MSTISSYFWSRVCCLILSINVWTWVAGNRNKAALPLVRRIDNLWNRCHVFTASNTKFMIGNLLRRWPKRSQCVVAISVARWSKIRRLFWILSVNRSRVVQLITMVWSGSEEVYQSHFRNYPVKYDLVLVTKSVWTHIDQQLRLLPQRKQAIDRQCYRFPKGALKPFHTPKKLPDSSSSFDQVLNVRQEVY